MQLKTKTYIGGSWCGDLAFYLGGFYFFYQPYLIFKKKGLGMLYMWIKIHFILLVLKLVKIFFYQNFKTSKIFLDFIKKHWRILKDMPCRIDKALKYIMASCVLHNYYQLQGRLKPIVRDMKQIGDPFLSQVQYVNCPNECDLAKVDGECIHYTLFASLLQWHPT